MAADKRTKADLVLEIDLLMREVEAKEREVGRKHQEILDLLKQVQELKDKLALDRRTEASRYHGLVDIENRNDKAYKALYNGAVKLIRALVSHGADTVNAGAAARELDKFTEVVIGASSKLERTTQEPPF